MTVTVSNTAPPPPSGLVAGWPMNDGQGTQADDVSGNGNGADLHGGTWTAGKYSGGLLLSGTGDYLSVPNSPSLNISGSRMTLSMWLNPAGGTGDQVVSWRESDRMHQAFVEAGRPSELLLIDGAPHAFQVDWRGEANQRAQ